jgi:hypothetical protein
MVEKRIYVVVADTVSIPLPTVTATPPNDQFPRVGDYWKVIKQPLGRQIAQAAHVTSKVRFAMEHGPGRKSKEFKAITTIVLAARDSHELAHLYKLLEAEEIPFEEFQDDNSEAYGPNVKIRTAIATHPVEPVDVQGILDYLPLWGSGRHIKIQ